MAEISSSNATIIPSTPVLVESKLNPTNLKIKIDIDCYTEILRYISDSDFSDDLWMVQVHEYHLRQKLYFACLTGVSEECKILCKCWVANMLGLSFAFESIKQNLSKVSVFLHFITDKKIKLQSIRNSMLEIFFKSYEDTPSVYNALSQAIQSFLEFCMQNRISFTETISCPVIDIEKSKNVRRAPDKCIIESLDQIFFNDLSLPADMRCVYLTLRLIINRVSEVLNMSLDCLSYPEEGVFTVSIPTQKETPMHIPHYEKYNRSLTDFYSSKLFESIQIQKEYALSQQLSLPEEFKGYLFVSSAKSSSLLTAADFNTFLKNLCIERGIKDADGNPAHISSHALRHFGITERLQSKIISPEQTMREANHSSLSTTLGYGYSSLHDEAVRNSKILKAVFPNAYASNGTSRQTVSENKYEVLKRNPFIRIIPGMGLCSNMRCKPCFEECINCKYFSPNKIYREYFEECIAIYQKRIELLEKSPARNNKAIVFNKERLKICEKYLERCDDL